MEKRILRLALVAAIACIAINWMGSTSHPLTGRSMDYSAMIERATPAVVNVSVSGREMAKPSYPPIVNHGWDENPEAALKELLEQGLDQELAKDTNKPGSSNVKGAPALPGFDALPGISGVIIPPFPPLTGQLPADPVHGLGSGFIIDSSGIIMTNAHVVDGADEVIVKLNDRREYTARVIGLDRKTDVAVLKIAATGLPVVKLGHSSGIRVGESVLAIGSPYGFDSSASAGIVSAKGRTLPDETYVSFIQTDVAVNPGNSGGPLFNARGEVIGINSQIYSQTGGFQGLSFAIPIDVAIHVKDEILQHGAVQRGRLGLTIQPVDAALADLFGLDKPTGALVTDMEKHGPVAKAGIRSGDIILSVDGHILQESAQLPAYVADVKPGKTIKLKVLSDKKTRDVSVVVAAVVEPQNTPKQITSNPAAAPGDKKLGVTAKPLDKALKETLGINYGLLVINSTGNAERAGIAMGDLLLSVNRESLTSQEQLDAAIKKTGKSALILVMRDGTRIYVAVTLH